jgi:hypothetical protein
MRAVRSVGLACATAAVLAAALPAPAAAIPPGRAGLYGGGLVRDYMHFVSVRVQRDGRASTRALLVTNCSPRFGDALTESLFEPNQELSPRGRRSATYSFSDLVDPGVATVGGLRADGTVASSVEVRRAGVARGVLRVRTTYSDPNTGKELTRCDTGRVPWAARRPPADAGSGHARVRPGTLRGTTSQDQAFLMRVTDRGRLVRRAGLSVRASCPSAVGLALDVVAHRVEVERGRFGARDRFRRSFTMPDGTELVESYSWTLRGRFGEVGARGGFRMRGTVRRRSDGERTGFCDTGRIAWRAVR